MDGVTREAGAIVGDDQHYYKHCCFRLHDTCEVLHATSGPPSDGHWNTWFFLQPYLAGTVPGAAIERDLP